jgi:hypothetical protein
LINTGFFIQRSARRQTPQIRKFNGSLGIFKGVLAKLRSAPKKTTRPPNSMRIKRSAPTRTMRPLNAMRVRGVRAVCQRGLRGHRTRC